MNSRITKQPTILALAAAIACLLTSCDRSNKAPESNAPAPSEETEETPTTWDETTANALPGESGEASDLTELGTTPEGELVSNLEVEPPVSDAFPAEDVTLLAQQLAHLEKMATSPIDPSRDAIEAGFAKCRETFSEIHGRKYDSETRQDLSEILKKATYESLDSIRQALSSKTTTPATQFAFEEGIANVMETLESM